MSSLKMRCLAIGLSAVAAGAAVYPAAPASAAPGKVVVSLTFDDGLSNQIENALPVLNKHGVKGSFYIVSRRIGGNGIMTEGQIKGLQNQGHEVGGHTVSHSDMLKLTQNEVRDELCNSRVDLKALGVRVTTLAYPFGHYDAGVQQAARDCGYNAARRVGPIRPDGGPVAAETLPAADVMAVRAPASFDNKTTAATIENYVENAIDAGGGWLPITFHTVCGTAPCADDYGVGANVMDQFLTWAKANPNVEFKTMDQVVGGAEKPAVPGPSRAADLKTAVEGPAQAKAGTTAAYTVSTTNGGLTAANGVKTVVNAPALTGIKAPGCAVAGTVITCDQGAIAATTEKKVIVTGKVNGAVGAVVKVSADATTTSTEWALPNKSEFGTLLLKASAKLKADMALKASTLGALKSKKTAKLKLTLVNRGGGTAKNVVLIAQLPKGLKIVSVAGCKRYGKHAIKCKASSFKPGATHTIWVKFKTPKLKKAVKVAFTAKVTTTSAETTKKNNKVRIVRKFVK
ncbi:polysaccharide deacetylase family protein [Actinocorallia longicatena]|uniref:NodB homology domain-containing protein n=1 Tax=Actinocorallia longicatena TaxID=111803 RepID=A0ABP6QIY7_9ACTN